MLPFCIFTAAVFDKRSILLTNAKLKCVDSHTMTTQLRENLIPGFLFPGIWRWRFLEIENEPYLALLPATMENSKIACHLRVVQVINLLVNFLVEGTRYIADKCLLYCLLWMIESYLFNIPSCITSVS